MRAAVAIAGAVVLGAIGAVCLLFGLAAGITLIDGETEYVDWFLALMTVIPFALGFACVRGARAAFRARS